MWARRSSVIAGGWERRSVGRCFAVAPLAFPHYNARSYSKNASVGLQSEIGKIRNIGISAHIDSGKTTLTERILYYTGRIGAMHEVKGKDGVGAKMDSMELERQKGITIKSAATYVGWGKSHINIIDTPGHVDFTIEVERSLRVLDGAVLVLCSVAGVQSQTLTVDRQMRRYKVPRVTFINKLDRMGADPWSAIKMMKDKLPTKVAAVQLPIGLENQHLGVVDLVEMCAYTYEGGQGERVERVAIPDGLLKEAKMRRDELLETLYEADDEVAELVMTEGREPTVEELKAAIRRATVNLKMSPVFMGSAYKNKGVQTLLDGVIDYLPSPLEKPSVALDLSQGEKEIPLSPDPKKPFVGLAFKLEESKFGQVTYMRIYQGTIKKGDMIENMTNNKKVKVPRLVRMHSDEMEEIQEVGPGEICAIFGVDCASGTTFTNGTVPYSLSSMFVPDPVISLAVWPKNKGDDKNLGRALNRFQREDPTFQVHVDDESNETIISGMGELHLEIYLERLRREYSVDMASGPPRVAYRETISKRVNFDHTHRKQTGGQGQFAKIVGYIEPLDEFDLEEAANTGKKVMFVNQTVGGSIPPNFIPAVEKGVMEASVDGPQVGHALQGMRIVVNDGAFHAVDSSDLAFRIAAKTAIREAIMRANPVILEPVMSLQVNVFQEHQSGVSSSLHRRKGVVLNATKVGDTVVIDAEVPLANMVGYATDLRSMTQGKGEFSMEFKRYQGVTRDAQEKLIQKYKEDQKEREAKAN